MKHIEPGCLAIIINSFTPSNIGKTVRVIEKIDSNTTYRMKVEGLPVKYAPSVYTRWLCEILSSAIAVARHPLTGNELYSNKGLCREDWLMPIGDEDYAKQVKEVVENVH